MATKNVNFRNDVLDGTGQADTLLGDWRDNVIFGHDGDDQILGDGGKDTLGGGDGRDELFGQSGDDRLFGDRGDDILNGGDDSDELHGGEDNDELRGGKGDDELYGDGGDDTIIDTEGVDKIEGGSGNDTIVMWGGDGFRFDTVSGGSGNDVISAAKSKVLVSAGSGDDIINTDLHGDKVLSGGAGSDRFVISSLETSAGRVIDILGGDGAVTRTWNIFGLEGIQSVTPGTDNSIDTLDLSQLGGLDASFLFGLEVGTINKLIVDLGDVHLGHGLLSHIHNGVDVGGGAIGRSFVEFLDNFGSHDSWASPTVPIEGQVAKLVGIENVIGSNGGDSIIGSSGVNELRGRGGDDFIAGGAGGDTLNGGSGADVIVGDFFGEGVFADTLTGGSEADHFVFADVAKETKIVTLKNGLVGQVQVPIADTITDFDAIGAVHDVIDLRALLNNRSNFIGSTVQEAFNLGYVFFAEQNGLTTVKVDLNGGNLHADTANVFDVVRLEGVSAIEMAAQRNDLFLV